MVSSSAGVPPRERVAVWTIAAAVFVIVTAELAPVGLLDLLSKDLGDSRGRMGLTLTVTGVVAAASAPVVAIISRAYDRRTILIGLLILVAVSSQLGAMASSLETLLALRVLVGVGIGGFWALAAGIAPRLVPPSRVAAASAVIFGGVGAATVIGVPLVTLVGEIAGWRVALLSCGAVSAVVAVVMAGLVPRLPAAPGAPPVRGTLAASVGSARGVLVTTTLVVTGHFAAFTFATPILTEHAGLTAVAVAPTLFAYGAAGLLGTALVGRSAALGPQKIAQIAAGGITISLLLLLTTPDDRPLALAVMLLWGLAYGAVGVCLQLWLLRVAGSNADMATALYVGIFNLSIAAGAALGGAAVDASGTLAIALALGAALASGAVLATHLRPTARSGRLIERNNR